MKSRISELKGENVYMKKEVASLYNIYEEEIKELHSNIEVKDHELNKSFN